MPTRLVTVWTCSTCPAESPKPLNHFELTGPGGTRAYDLCDDCRDSNPTVVAFLAVGERRTAGRPKGPAKPAKASAAAPPVANLAKPTAVTPIASKAAKAVATKAAKPVATKVAKPRKTKAGFLCPECTTPYPTERSLAQHRSRIHAVASKTAIMMSKRGRTGDRLCDDCDFRTTTGQGLAAHRRSAHAA